MAWLDAPTWVQNQLDATFPAWQITPEADDVRLNQYPSVVWSLQLSNPDSRGIWTGNLTLTLTCEPRDADGHVGALHDAVQAWQTPGPIQGVTLINYAPDRSPAGRAVRTYVLIYSLTWDH
ncbi:hypothetical protein [Micropruina sp.]|uniref:hypothetical protein n=1 Tax=Micropruina sp. TaxID=2737536 RepID=UPI0039E3A9EA